MSGATPPPLPPPVPVPVQTLAYTARSDQRRPGIITALGVVAIVVAALSGVVSFFTFFYGGVFYAVMLPMMTAASGPTTRATGSTMTFSVGSGANPNAAPAAQAPGQEKLSMSDASTVVSTLGSMLNLDGARVRELDKLVRAHGREIIGGPVDEDDDTPGPITDAWLRESIRTQHTPLGANSAAWFTNKQGRVEIFPDHAVFRSADGSRTIRSSAAQRTESETTSGNSGDSSSVVVTSPSTQPAGTTLTKAEIRSILRAVRRASSRPLTAAQVTAVEQQLSLPNQGFVTPGASTPVMSVTPMGNSTFIQFDQGMMNVGRQGQIISTNTATSFTGLPANVGRVRPPLLLMVLEGAGSLALAVYLLVVGILVCRSSFRSPKLLRAYALIKIPLACLAGFAVGWLAWRIMEVAATASATSGTAPPPTPAWFSGALFWAATAFILGVAFPIAVLICLRTRTVREHFNSVSS
jgi:hypothetical protein